MVRQMVDKKKTEEKTTIEVTKDLAARLRKLGHMGDTYTIVIQRLIEGNGMPHTKEPGEDE